MKQKRIVAVIADCLRRLLPLWGFSLVLIALNTAVFVLYCLPTEPLLYMAVVAGCGLTAVSTVACFRAVIRARQRTRFLEQALWDTSLLPSPASLEERDYHRMLNRLHTRLSELTADAAAERTAMLDYYTVWVHQIKTPIAVMRMLLAQKDTEENRALLSELFRIEQYAEMVLHYIRLESDENDLVVREYALDELIRSSIRKYAPQFIGRKLKLNYAGTAVRIVTDRKWFSCLLEQLLSNAVKYTPAGEVTVAVSKNGRLTVSDTGIGIAAEDIPRIFERGFTGINGHQEQKSSGLGLYLCRKAADKLSFTLSVSSTPGKGTTFTVNMPTVIEAVPTSIAPTATGKTPNE